MIVVYKSVAVKQTPVGRLNFTLSLLPITKMSSYVFFQIYLNSTEIKRIPRNKMLLSDSCHRSLKYIPH